MRTPQGYATIFDPDRPLVERDTITCSHCQRIVFVKPGTGATTYLFPQMQGPDKEEPGAFCTTCMSAICIQCCAEGTCTPFMKKLELYEKRQRLLRAVGV
jgi:hypothetical protein